MKINWFASDEEKNDSLQLLWAKYGRSLILMFVLCCCMIVAKEAWTNHQNKEKAKASIIYMHMMDDLNNADHAAAKKQSAQLIKSYPNSLYANLAQLLAIKDMLIAHHLDEATTHLQKLITHTPFPLIQDIARIRLGRIYIAQHHTQEAMITMNAVQSHEYKYLAAYYLGDLYTIEHHPKKAKASYQYALNSLPFAPNAALKKIITFKIHQLGTSPYTNMNIEKPTKK